MSDDDKILEMVVRGDTAVFQARRVIMPDDVLDPEAQVVPDQDEFYEGGYYVRPRPPAFTKSNKLISRSLRYGAFEMGVARVVTNPQPQTVVENGLIRQRPVGFFRLELWYRNPNTGELRIMGDCLPVEYVTERDGIKAEHDFMEWQRVLGIPEHRIIPTMREAMKGSGRGPQKIEHVADLPPAEGTHGPATEEQARDREDDAAKLLPGRDDGDAPEREA